MNETFLDLNGTLTQQLNADLQEPPPGAIYGWPGCSYPQPLPDRSLYALATEYIWKTVPCILLLTGTIGNILSALVISRHYRKTATTPVYLLSLSIVDTLFLFTDPLQRWIQSVTGFQLLNTSNWFCKLSTFLTNASFHVSAWILVAVTAERTISVIWPYKVHQRCTQRNEELVTSAIIVAVFLMDSHLLYGFGTFPLQIYHGENQCMPMYNEYSSFYHTIWFWIHFVFGFAAPFLSIVVGNALVIQGLRKMRRNERWMEDAAYMAHMQSKDDSHQHYHHHHHHHHHAYHARTVMMILVLLNTEFFISQTPLALYYVFFTHSMKVINDKACTDFAGYMLGAEKLWFWQAVTYNFGYLNASLNFVLYVLSGSRFREEIKDFLLCRGEMRRRSLTTVSNDSSRRHTLTVNSLYFKDTGISGANSTT